MGGPWIVARNHARTLPTNAVALRETVTVISGPLNSRNTVAIVGYLEVIEDFHELGA